MKLEDLDLNFINDKYINDFRSLNKTCEWLLSEYGIKTNRIKLSQLFHQAGLDVQPPNGKPALWYGDQTNSFQSAESEFAADWLELLVADILEWLDGSGSKINYMSACWAFSGPVYVKMLMTLQFGGPLIIDANSLPDGISEEVILNGRDLYLRGYDFWVSSPGEPV